MTEEVILIYFLLIIPSKHWAEACQEGLSEDIVPQMTEEEEDEQAKLQRLLMLQQNKLLAQLQQAYLEDDLEVSPIQSYLC